MTAAALFSLTDNWLLALSLGGMAAFCFALAFGHLSYGQSFRTEIRSRGALAWSWRQALVVGLLGTSLSLLWSGVTWLQDPGSARWLVNLLNAALPLFLLGGVSGKRVETRSRPNEGIWIAGQNGVKVALLLAVATALLAGLTVNFASGLFTALLFGLLAGVVHGINDVSKHVVVRLLLWLDRRTPLDYAHFLDYAARCGLLRKVGGGYAFQHQLLLEYFARNGSFDGN